MSALNSYKNFLRFIRTRKRDAAAIVAQLAALAGPRLDSVKALSADGEETAAENEVKPMLGKAGDGTYLWTNDRLRKLFVAVQDQFPQFLLDLSSEKYQAAEAAAKAMGVERPADGEQPVEVAGVAEKTSPDDPPT